jgi:Xaa-Pro aminopeptidase
MGASGWIESGDRVERAREAMRRAHLDALLALTPENAAYLSGRTSTIATLWRVPGLVAVAVGADGALAVVAGDNEIGAYPEERFTRFPHPLWIEHLDLRHGADAALEVRERIAAARHTALSRPAQYDLDAMHAAIVSAARAVAPNTRRLGADLASVPMATFAALESALTGIELVDATALFADLRAVKDAVEIAHLRRAAELTEIGIAAARDALRPGLSDVGVVAAYQTAIWRRAAADGRYAALRQVEGLASVGDSASGVPVAPGQTVKLDMQVDVGGYHSDVGRTFALAPTQEQVTVYAALRDALAAVVAATLPRNSFREVHAAGIEAMRAAGFTNYSRGHLGHSVGLSHNYEEPPFVSAEEARLLAPNMVLSLELPYYLLGVGSFQLEHMVLVTDAGNEPLDRLPFTLAVDDATKA